MRVVVVGLGVQGRKRLAVAGAECVATVDPVVNDADYVSLNEVDPSTFDAALLCVPDSAKLHLVERLVSLGKHVLVEKPLDLGSVKNFERLEREARQSGSCVVTAYNHRFEPHISTVKGLLADHVIGEIYRCNLFYGNGTAQLVRGSEWRDREAGVIPDLGSHLLDIVDFWFDRDFDDISLISSNAYENRSPDHAVLGSTVQRPDLLLEMSLLSWRNSFHADLIGSEGSIHIRSLCKWSESELLVRRRTRPSGTPTEERSVAPQGDPTWQREYEAFVHACEAGNQTSLRRDAKIAKALERMRLQVSGGAA
jgi:predicted dehydrogenase